MEAGADPAPVPISRLTVIRAEPFADAAAAERWLDSLAGDRAALEEEIAAATATINAALHAHAVATQDPAVAQAGPAHALARRVGFGSGDGLADGRWSKAIEVPQRHERRRRTEALRPAERVAAVLGGRERLDACETLLLRARADLDAGRAREAALQLRVGLEALMSEIGSGASPDQADDLAELEARREPVAALAREALGPAHAADRAAELEGTLQICERVLRRRRILGAGEPEAS